MFQLSEEASEKIKQFLEGREGPRSIRILLTEGGWKGPHLVMALDEPKENDQVFTERGVTLLIEKALFERVRPISIDYVLNAMGGGYMLKSDLLKGNGVECECEDICETCYPHC